MESIWSDFEGLVFSRVKEILKSQSGYLTHEVI